MGCNHHKAPPERGEVGPRIMFLSKLIRRTFNEAVSEQGLFSGQQDIIFKLAENEGMTQSDLSKQLRVSGATVSVSVKRMEKAGFITKKADENDARITRLYLTERAKQTPDNIHKKMNDLDESIKNGMTQDEVYLLSDLLQKAIDNLLNRGDKKC